MALSACGRIGFDPTSGIDGGAVPSVFTEVVLPDGASVTELARGTDGTLYAVLGDTRVVRSSNLGASWIDCAAIVGGVRNVAVDPSTGSVYVAGPPGLLRSVDACATWSSTGLTAYGYNVTVFDGARDARSAGAGDRSCRRAARGNGWQWSVSHADAVRL